MNLESLFMNTSSKPNVNMEEKNWAFLIIETFKIHFIFTFYILYFANEEG
jgi:hypothetical protein